MIATDVGNCRELIYGGDTDSFGTAGILTHIMNLEEIADAMVELAQNESLRIQMGENGYKRVMDRYRIEHMKQIYKDIYMELAQNYQAVWTEDPFELDQNRKKKKKRGEA